MTSDGRGLEDIKEVRALCTADAANERLETGKWRLLEVSVAPSYHCVQDRPEKIFMNSHEVIYIVGRYKD